MDSTFLIMLAVPWEIEFCKVPSLYDIPKLHTESLGIDPCASIMIGTITASLSHILAISNRSSDQLSCFLFFFQNQIITAGTSDINYQTFIHIFSITTISGLRCNICLSTWIHTSHWTFTISFSMTGSTLCSYHLSHTFTSYFFHKIQWMWKHALSCLLLYSFCGNILQPLAMSRTLSTRVPDNLHLYEKSLR